MIVAMAFRYTKIGLWYLAVLLTLPTFRNSWKPGLRMKYFVNIPRYYHQILHFVIRHHFFGYIATDIAEYQSPIFVYILSIFGYFQRFFRGEMQNRKWRIPTNAHWYVRFCNHRVIQEQMSILKRQIYCYIGFHCIDLTFHLEIIICVLVHMEAADWIHKRSGRLFLQQTSSFQETMLYWKL